MLASEKTFEEISYNVAAAFLQTVVVIDDRASFDAIPESPVPEFLNTPNRRVDVPDPQAQRSNENGALLEDNKRRQNTRHDLDAKKLTDVFAGEGVICSIIKPSLTEIEEFDNLLSKTLNSAERSDIVVLDWQLGPDGGKHTLAVISKLSHKESTFPHRYRLIVIYTGDGGIQDILTKIEIELDDNTFVKEHGVLTNGRIRISVFSKHDSIASDFKDLVVFESQLPVVLIKEFSKMAGGIVPNVALVSLTALRDNAHRLLRRFNKRLDAAYLSNRAMLEHPSDAEDQIVEIVAAEMHDVLEQSNVTEYAAMPIIRAWMNEHEQELSFPSSLGIKRSVSEPSSAVLKLLEYGCDNKTQLTDFESFGDKPYRKINASVFSTDKNDQLVDSEYELLATTRTEYCSVAPILSLGQVLRLDHSPDVSSFWICMQPRCDSLRVNGSRQFLLVPLIGVKNAEKSDVIIRSKPNVYLYYRLGKSFDAQLVEFDGDAAKGTIPALELNKASEDVKFSFVSSSGLHYTWIAQLKESYAQDLSHRFSTGYGRVAVDRPERWRRINDA